MRNFLAGVMVAGFVVAITVPVLAKAETVTGQIVDQNCYMKDKVNNKGVDHKMPADTKDCAIACAKKGQPLALLTSDGKVYTIAGDLAADNNAKLIPHISHTVAISGDTMDMNGKMMITAANIKMISK
jgi:predicted metal-binding protein